MSAIATGLSDVHKTEVIPSVVVNLVAIARGIDNVQPKTNAILLNNYRRVSSHKKFEAK